MKYLTDPSAVQSAVAMLAASPWAALDAEADSLHHYRERLCLFQVSTPTEDFVVDPLAGADLREFVRVLGERPLYLHGADFDIRILKKNYEFAPREIFDTMIAAQLLGYEKQGLADLALKHCGVALPKTFQKADWSVRPLKAALLEYAANDTHYLKTIADALTAELVALERLEWHRQNCARLLEILNRPEELSEDDGRRWQVKGSKELKGRALTLLKALWHWREAEAEKIDKPSFKVLNTEYLVQIARWAAETTGPDIALMPKAPRHLAGRYRESLNALLKQTLTHPQAEWTSPKRTGPRPKWGERENKILEELKKERETLAKSLKIQPSLIANNAALEALILARPKTKEAILATGILLPWQTELFAEAILKAAHPA